MLYARDTDIGIVIKTKTNHFSVKAGSTGG